jgi:hypothetical protein
MASDAQLSRGSPEIIWPSMAAASAELRRPRSLRAGRAENPAVLRLVQSASVTTITDFRARRNAHLGGGR